MTVRYVHPDLQAELDSGETTICQLLKVVPVAPGKEPFGLTSLDHDVVYDDGDGELTYYSALGADLSAHTASADMAVDNAESTGLMPEFDVPIPVEDFSSGAFDYAQWTLYMVSYKNLTSGRHAELGGGEIGRVNVVDGMKFVLELLGRTHRLKQSIVEKDSLRCRATFGSQAIGTEDAEVVERFPCGKDITGMWVDGVVTGLSVDLHYVIQTDLAAPAGTYRPGAIRWKPGSTNAGRTYEVEDHLDDGVIVLAFPLMFAPADGDEFEIRPDCSKWKEGTNGCKFHWDTAWVLHYRGEPWIPVGEQDRLNSPGASG